MSFFGLTEFGSDDNIEYDLKRTNTGGDKMIDNVKITGKVTLAELRRLEGMTQEKFAKYVGIPYTTYRRYERNIGSAGFSEVVQICDKVGIGIENIKV